MSRKRAVIESDLAYFQACLVACDKELAELQTTLQDDPPLKEKEAQRIIEYVAKSKSNTEQTNYRDSAGKPILIGSPIVYRADVRGSSFKYGVVIQLTSTKRGWRSGRRVLRLVSVSPNYPIGATKWELQKDGKPITLTYLDSVLVIPWSLMPDGARELLSAVELKEPVKPQPEIIEEPIEEPVEAKPYDGNHT